MSVVGEHLANELSRVLQGHAHPVVDLGVSSVSITPSVTGDRGRIRT